MGESKRSVKCWSATQFFFKSKCWSDSNKPQH